MSDAPRSYSPLYIRVWTIFSIGMGIFLLLLFVCGDHLLHLGHIVWALLRWIFRPIL